MKNKKILSILLLSLTLGACNLSNNTSSNLSSIKTSSNSVNSIDSNISEISSNVSSTTNKNSSSSTQNDVISISDVRNNKIKGEEVKIEGVVVKHNYTGQQTPYITGFWMADNTGSIYVYGQNVAQSVKEGNKVVISGVKAFYIPQNDTSAAASLNYEGMLQIASPVLLSNDNNVNEIPSNVITETTIAEINDIPLSTNISGNIYKVKGRYSVSQASDFTNYYLNDLNRVDSIMAYTQSNGKDYAWTNELDGKTVEMLIIVSLAKPGVNSWRMCPVSVLNDDVIVSDQEEATYALNRVIDHFDNTYNVDTVIEISREDQYLEGSSIDISSSSNNVSIDYTNESILVSISAETLGKIELNVSLTYNSATVSKSFEVEIVKQTNYETTSIAEAKVKENGTVVTLEAIVAKVTYKSSMTKQGLFLVDETGALFSFFGTSILNSLTDIEEGHKIVIRGTIDHYIKNASNAQNENYSGDLQLVDGEILDHDKNIYDIPLTAYTESSITELANTLPENNISSNIYKVQAKVIKNTGYSTSYSLADVNGSATIPLYSQNSGNDFKWLDDYLNQEVTILVGIQNLNLKSSGSFYRGCPIKVL